ncbi:MAG: glycosyltransferase family 4 protein [Pseudomonadota bacterium]
MDEKEAIAQADHCVCLSHADYAEMKGVARSISVVRPYANPPKISARPFQDMLVENDAPATTRGLDRFDLILWGDWHRGNVSSSTWFFERVYPRLTGNNLQVAVVGRLCEALPRWIKELKNVHILGRVDNLHDFMNHSTIMVIYDRGGSGISIKAMETLAAGKAFVGTKVGMRQVDLGTSRYKPSDSEEELADDIQNLLDSNDEIEKRQDVSISLYQNNFSKEHYQLSWDKIIASILNDQNNYMK